MIWELTGRVSYKKNFWGSLILWVEIRDSTYKIIKVVKWRKATEEDLSYLAHDKITLK